MTADGCQLFWSLMFCKQGLVLDVLVLTRPFTVRQEKRVHGIRQ